jgi:hypothetical protein
LIEVSRAQWSRREALGHRRLPAAAEAEVKVERSESARRLDYSPASVDRAVAELVAAAEL